jgi:hypothetical protein
VAESECHGLWCNFLDTPLGLDLANFTAFNHRWHMPSSTSGGVANMWCAAPRRAAPRR